MNRKGFARSSVQRLLGLSLVLAMGFLIFWPADAKAEGGGGG